MSILNYESNNSKLQNESWKNLRQKSKNINYNIVNNSFDQESWFDKDDTRDCILLVGNSHSKDVYNTFLSCKVATDSFQIARYGVQNAELVSKTHSLYNSPNYKQSRIIILASLHSATDLEIFPIIIENIKEDGKLIVIFKNVHRFTTHGRKTLADFYIQDKIKETKGFEKDSLEVADLVQRINHEYFIRKTEAKINHINQNISKLGFNHDVVLVLDRMDYMCDSVKKECYVVNENLEKYLYDYGHNTLAGAKFYGKRISEIDWLRDVFDLMEKNNKSFKHKN